MNKKKFVFIAGCIGFILCLLQAVFILRKDRQITIELGIFAGSNWDVANANSYVIIDKAIERFEQEHKNVKIHYTSGILKRDYSEWLAQQLLMGKMPDVFMILSDDFNRLASLGALKNLEKLMNKDTAFKLEKYFSTTLLTGQYNGIQFALPYETVPTLMFVNKTLLKKEGIEVPDSDWTWDDLLEISKKVTKDTDGDGYPDQFGTYNYDWLDAAYTNGVVLFENGDTKISLTNEKVVEAVKFVKQLYDLNQGRKVTQDDFDSGKVAFMPLTFADYRTYKTYPYKIKNTLISGGIALPFRRDRPETTFQR